MDSEFKDVNMTPLRDDLEYDLDLDCKIPLEKDQTFEVLHEFGRANVYVRYERLRSCGSLRNDPKDHRLLVTSY